MISIRQKGKMVLRAIRNNVLFVFVGLSLTACSSGISGVSPGAPSLAPGASLSPSIRPTQTLAKQVTMNRPTKTVSIAMAPIIGPPGKVVNKLTKKIASELKARNINVVKSKRGYNMRGYVVSSAEASGAKLAYIWDLNNKSGRRQHRITGEQTVSGGKSSDPWRGVSDTVIASIASDTADQLAGWLVKKNGGQARTVARSSSGGRKLQANRVRSARGSPSRASRRTKAGKSILMAMVVPVSGAPGDGKSSLTKAIKKKLYAKGIRLTSKRTASVYQVRGVVQVGKTKKGKQPIRIDWRVYDPNGKRLGTVTQKNEIPQGSLNGSWGPIADAAAGAAANGITKLLPKSIRRL